MRAPLRLKASSLPLAALVLLLVARRPRCELRASRPTCTARRGRGAGRRRPRGLRWRCPRTSTSPTPRATLAIAPFCRRTPEAHGTRIGTRPRPTSCRRDGSRWRYRAYSHGASSRFAPGTPPPGRLPPAAYQAATTGLLPAVGERASLDAETSCPRRLRPGAAGCIAQIAFVTGAPPCRVDDPPLSFPVRRPRGGGDGTISPTRFGSSPTGGFRGAATSSRSSTTPKITSAGHVEGRAAGACARAAWRAGAQPDAMRLPMIPINLPYRRRSECRLALARFLPAALRRDGSGLGSRLVVT